MKRCPACGLPIGLRDLTVCSGSSDDSKTHGIFALCARCTNERRRLPASSWNRMVNRAADRALADPSKYLCSTFSDVGATRLAFALLGHPAHSQEALKILGWGGGVGEAEKTPPRQS